MIDKEKSSKFGRSIIADFHNWQSLVDSFMDEWLYLFHSNGFIEKELEIVSIDRDVFRIKSHSKGENINIQKHTQNSEIKAITYNNIYVSKTEDRCDIWVIVGI